MEKLLNKQELAGLLKISVKTVDLWMKKGIGPKPFRIGRLVRFKDSDVESFIQQLSEEK